jgi:putative ABC transport system permease protein
VGDVRFALLLLFAAVGCVLLIACANVASLSLVRANARQREFAIRSALGATRQQVARELLIESMLLGLAGGLVGLLLAVWSTRLLLNFLPRGLPRIDETTLDGRVFGFALGVALLTGVLFGLAPAFRAGRTDLTEALREGSLGTGDGKRRNRFRSSLVVAQIAVSLVLLVCAGLLVGSFWRLQQVDPGFDAKNIITLRISLPDTRYDESQVENFYERLLSRIETLPGVTSASAGSAPPLTKLNSEVAFAIEDAPAESEGHYPVSFYRVIRPNYFRTLNIPLLQGRDFEARDTTDSTPVAIVNESLARKYFPHENPLGRRINPGLKSSDQGRQWREIIGVVKDVRHATLAQESGAELYVPHSQKQWGTLTLVARTSNDPVSIVGAVRREVAALDKNVPLYSVETLEEYVAAALAQQRFQTLLLTLFATVALILTAVGLYGLVSYSVAQRTREIGIRIALGARIVDVLKLIVKGGLALALTGVGLGLAGALALTRFIASLLFGVSATDAATFITVSVVLLAVTLLACYLPARRATRVDPLVALRYE